MKKPAGELPDWDNNSKRGNQRMLNWLDGRLSEQDHAAMLSANSPENAARTRAHIEREAPKSSALHEARRTRLEKFAPLLTALRSDENAGLVSKQTLAELTEFVEGRARPEHYPKRGRPTKKPTNKRRYVRDEAIWMGARGRASHQRTVA